jgi:hypothetical protein
MERVAEAQPNSFFLTFALLGNTACLEIWKSLSYSASRAR